MTKNKCKIIRREIEKNTHWGQNILEITFQCLHTYTQHLIGDQKDILLFLFAFLDKFKMINYAVMHCVHFDE